MTTTRRQFVGAAGGVTLIAYASAHGIDIPNPLKPLPPEMRRKVEVLRDGVFERGAMGDLKVGDIARVYYPDSSFTPSPMLYEITRDPEAADNGDGHWSWRVEANPIHTMPTKGDLEEVRRFYAERKPGDVLVKELAEPDRGVLYRVLKPHKPGAINMDLFAFFTA